MIGMRTILEVADNSGARRLQCIAPRGGDLGLRAGLGDVITASVKEAAPDSAIKKGKVVRCVIVRMRKETRRRDGTYIRFDSNAAVLITETLPLLRLVTYTFDPSGLAATPVGAGPTVIGLPTAAPVVGSRTETVLVP